MLPVGGKDAMPPHGDVGMWWAEQQTLKTLVLNPGACGTVHVLEDVTEHLIGVICVTRYFFHVGLNTMQNVCRGFRGTQRGG